MGFSEQLKLKIKRRAHFCCSLCHAVGVEVHHIIPAAEGSLDTEDNAAPLCPSCHETYGANAEKRKFIREARDFWYEICEKRYASDPARLEEIADLIKDKASKSDLKKGVDKIIDMLQTIADRSDTSQAEKQREVSQLSGTIGITPFGGVSAGRYCERCHTYIGLLVGDQGRCPSCGAPW